jgi:DNA primase
LRKTVSQQEPEPEVDVLRQPAGRQNQIDPLDISEHEKQIMRLLLLFGNRKIQPPDVETEKIIDEFGKEVVVVQEEYVAKYVLTNLENDGIVFENELYNQMADEIKKMLETGKVPDEQYFTRHADDKIAGEAVSLIATPYELSNNWKKNKIYVKSEEDDLSKTVISTLNQFRIKVISRYLREITEKMKTTSDDAEIFILQQQFFELKKVAKEIDNELHRIFDY